METKGRVFKYPDNVDTDVIIPARYLNTSDAKELAKHCMEDIDNTYVAVPGVLLPRASPVFFTVMQLISVCPFLNVSKRQRKLQTAMR